MIDASAMLFSNGYKRQRRLKRDLFEVPDIEAARVHLINHGAVMSEPSAWGSCDGADPEGNVFQIVRM